MVKRFHGKAGEEYELFKLACPHFELLENNIGKIIKKQFYNKTLDKIHVLEIGCGPGYTTIIVLDADKRIKIVAVDNEKVMISQARIILKSFINKKRAVLVEDDALTFLRKQKSNSFDVFVSGFTLHNFTKKYREQVIKEICRVLKSEGIFLNADKYAIESKAKHRQALVWQLQQFKIKYSKINRLDLVDERTRHYLEDEKPNIIMREKESINYMNKMGFRDANIVFRKYMDAVLFAKK